jgi:hypothetical protein
VSFTSRPLYPRRKRLRNPFYRKMSDLRADLNVVEKRLTSCSCRESNPSRLSRSSSLYRLIYFGNIHLMISSWQFITLTQLLSIKYLSMSVEPFVGPWPLLQFRNIFYTDGRSLWTSDQPVARPLPKHRTTQAQNKRTQTFMP